MVNKAKTPSLTTSLQHCTGSSNHCKKKSHEKERTGTDIGQEKKQLSFFIGNTIVLENPKESTHIHTYTKLLELICEFRKVIGYKVTI